MKLDAKAAYATMPPWRLFFTLALPGMVSMFAMSIYSIIEGVFIGQILGEGAFAAVNIAMPLVMINFSLADLVGFMADSDPDVLQDVMDKFSEAIDDPDLGDRELSSILTSVSKVLNNEDAVEALFFAIESDMRHSVAVQTYLNVWENGSKEVQAKVLESISDFTGEDDISTPEQLKKWLEENPDDEDDEDFYAGAKDDDVDD